MGKQILKHKETSSTLLESFKSANSLRERLNFEFLTSNKGNANESKDGNIERRVKRKHSLMSESLDICLQSVKSDGNNFGNGSSHSPIATTPDNEEDSPKKRKSQICSNMKESNVSNKLYMKGSGIGRRMMSMSIEIES